MIKKICSICVTLGIMFMLTGCNADSINNAINAAGSEMGVEIDSNITQEQVDEVKGAIKDLKDDVVDIVTDEEVKGAAGNLLDALKGAVDKNEE